MASILGEDLDWQEFKRWLSSLPAETLAGWLFEAAVREASLTVVLRCEAAQAAAGGLDVEGPCGRQSIP